MNSNVKTVTMCSLENDEIEIIIGVELRLHMIYNTTDISVTIFADKPSQYSRRIKFLTFC